MNQSVLEATAVPAVLAAPEDAVTLVLTRGSIRTRGMKRICGRVHKGKKKRQHRQRPRWQQMQMLDLTQGRKEEMRTRLRNRMRLLNNLRAQQRWIQRES
jgi:hypothetical protein